MSDKLLSVVIPVYNGASTIGDLVHALGAQDFGLPIEIILVNDGSEDGSQEVCEHLAQSSQLPITLASHARNFGEHNAVMTGLRLARGTFVMTMDDDLQHPPAEGPLLLNALIESDLDIVYGEFQQKKHDAWRNLGSRLANWVMNWISDKPRGLKLTTFRCMSRFLVDQIIRYQGPHPFVDGLVFQNTTRAGSAIVEHHPNQTGRQNYTIGKLVTLWLTILVNFSTRPIQASIVLGIAMAAFGAIGAVYIIVDYILNDTAVRGWPSLAVLIMVFTGVQLVVLGLVGEYVGRMFLDIGGRPQAVVRNTFINSRYRDLIKDSEPIDSKTARNL